MPAANEATDEEYWNEEKNWFVAALEFAKNGNGGCEFTTKRNLACHLGDWLGTSYQIDRIVHPDYTDLRYTWIVNNAVVTLQSHKNVNNTIIIKHKDSKVIEKYAEIRNFISYETAIQHTPDNIPRTVPVFDPTHTDIYIDREKQTWLIDSIACIKNSPRLYASLNTRKDLLPFLENILGEPLRKETKGTEHITYHTWEDECVNIEYVESPQAGSYWTNTLHLCHYQAKMRKASTYPLDGLQWNIDGKDLKSY